MIQTTWSDRNRYEIYRKYGEFFTFQVGAQCMHRLLRELIHSSVGCNVEHPYATVPSWSRKVQISRENPAHPAQWVPLQHTPCNCVWMRVEQRSPFHACTNPIHLAIDNVLSILGRTNSKTVLMARLQTIDSYCQVWSTELYIYVALKEVLSLYVYFLYFWHWDWEV